MEEEITSAVITCGHSHTACITRRGMLYTFGLGNHGELGLPVPANDIAFPERVFLTSKPHLRVVSIAVSASLTGVGWGGVGWEEGGWHGADKWLRRRPAAF